MAAINTVRKFFPNVKVVVDAKTAAKIEVTKKDCSSAQVKKHNQCAMAVACKRKFHLDGVIISRSIAYLVKGNKARRFELPQSVIREVVSFDRGAGFAEGEYQLAAVSPANRSDRPSRVKKDNGKPHKGEPIEKRFRHLTTGVRSVLGGLKPE